MGNFVDIDDLQDELDFLFNHFETQRDLAKAVGVDQGIISLIKNGKRKRVLKTTAQNIKSVYGELIGLKPIHEPPKKKEKIKKLEVGKSYKFTRTVGPRQKRRKEVARLTVIAEYKRFYAVTINGTKDTVLKNDLQTDMYELQPY